MRLHQRVLAISLGFSANLLEQAGGILGRWRSMVCRDDAALAGGEAGRSGLLLATLGVRGQPAECLQAIIDGLDDEVMIITPDFHVRQANRTVLRRLGMQVVGQPCYRVSHGGDEPCRPPWCECPLQQVMAKGESVRAVHTRHYQGGEGEQWVEMVVAPVWDTGGRVTGVVELVRDVSESKKLQGELLRANRELLALNNIGRALNQSLDLGVTLQAVADTMLDALEVSVSWIKLTGDGKVPVARASRGLPEKAVAEVLEAANQARRNDETGDSAGPGLPWRFAMTALTLKGAVLGSAGVASAGRAIDERRVELLGAIGNQISAAIERCQLYEEIKLAGDRRGELLREVITAQEEERRRIARELHDETAQCLTALRLGLERLCMTPGADELKVHLTQPLALCRDAEDGVDKLIFALRPALLDDLGLVEALRSHAESHLEAAGIALTFRVDGEDRRMSGEKEMAIFRVMQEAINNIIRHAGATSVNIQLQFRKNDLVVTLEDNGCGFDTAAPAPMPRSARHGLGLLGMKERIGLVGGRLIMTSRPGAGTRLEAIVPLSEARARL